MTCWQENGRCIGIPASLADVIRDTRPLHLLIGTSRTTKKGFLVRFANITPTQLIECNGSYMACGPQRVNSMKIKVNNNYKQDRTYPFFRKLYLVRRCSLIECLKQILC
eukprot:sb/3477408/